MKCPFCAYKNEYNEKGKWGEFYEMTNDIVMSRSRSEVSYGEPNTEQRRIWGCPKCAKIFMGTYIWY